MAVRLSPSDNLAADVGDSINWRIIALVLAATTYNAILGYVNANIAALGRPDVMIAELIIQSCCIVFLIRSGIRPSDFVIILFMIFMFLCTLAMSFLNEEIILEAPRNALIMAVFVMVGSRANEITLRRCFTLLILLVFAVMVLELAAVGSYVALFEPSKYFFATRGIEEYEFSDSGLFRNALGFEGRFNFGLFNAPRTSSIFLEQTSLSNFASVIAVFLLALWPRIGWWERLLAVSFVTVALLSNSTRMSSILAVLTVGGYWIYPRLPRYSNLALPVLLLGLAAFIVPILPPSQGDDFSGRLSLTLNLLLKTDILAFFGGRALEADSFPDSGYPYLIYSSTVFGAIAIYLFVALIVPQQLDMQRRAAFGISMLVFVSLLVAGNAIFSIKIAAAMWFLAGYMRSISPGADDTQRIWRSVPRWELAAIN